MSNPHIGSSFDSWLEEEGIFEEAEMVARQRVEAWQKRQERRQPAVFSASPRRGAFIWSGYRMKSSLAVTARAAKARADRNSRIYKRVKDKV